MTLCFYTQQYEKQLLDFLNHSPQTTIGHLPQWGKIYQKTFNYKSYSLIALNDEKQVCGYFPLYLVKDILFRNFLISTPFTNFSGIIDSGNTHLHQKFIDKAKEIAQKTKAQYVEIRQLKDNKLGLPGRDGFVTMFLDLTDDIDTIWKKSLNSKVRNQVRKAQKNKIEIVENDNLNNFYAVYSRNMRDLGSPVFPFPFFQEIKKQFGKNCEILSVSHQEKIIASMFIIKWGKYFSDPWASSIREYNRLNPNNLLYWHAIKKACTEGYKIFDMGRSTIKTGTYHFKKQWGCQPVELNYNYIFNRSNEIPQVNANDNKYENIIKLWKKLPLPLANFVGAKIIKYLPEL